MFPSADAKNTYLNAPADVRKQMLASLVTQSIGQLMHSNDMANLRRFLADPTLMARATSAQIGSATHVLAKLRSLLLTNNEAFAAMFTEGDPKDFVDYETSANDLDPLFLALTTQTSWVMQSPSRVVRLMGAVAPELATRIWTYFQGIDWFRSRKEGTASDEYNGILKLARKIYDDPKQLTFKVEQEKTPARKGEAQQSETVGAEGRLISVQASAGADGPDLFSAPPEQKKAPFVWPARTLLDVIERDGWSHGKDDRPPVLAQWTPAFSDYLRARVERWSLAGDSKDGTTLDPYFLLSQAERIAELRATRAKPSYPGPHGKPLPLDLALLVRVMLRDLQAQHALGAQFKTDFAYDGDAYLHRLEKALPAEQ